MSENRLQCRHCCTKYVNRPRGLCWGCYYKLGVREQYQSTSRHARRGVGNGYNCNPPLPVPTNAIPGTEEKIAVLAARAEAGQALFHPDDQTKEKNVTVLKMPIDLNPEQQARLQQVHKIMRSLANSRDYCELIQKEISTVEDELLSQSMLLDDLESIAANTQLDFNDMLGKLQHWVLTGEAK